MICVERFQFFEVPVSSIFFIPTAQNANAFGARIREVIVVFFSLFIRPQWRTVFSFEHHT